MNVKIDVNVNLSNIEVIINKISKLMDLNRINSNETVNLNNKTQSVEVTADTLRYLLTELAKEGKTQEVKDILKKYNCTKIPQLNKSDYNQVYLELKQIRKGN